MKFSIRVKSKREVYSRNPNLKRYIESVKGSSLTAYCGGGVASCSAYAGSSTEMRRSWRLSRVVSGAKVYPAAASASWAELREDAERVVMEEDMS